LGELSKKYNECFLDEISGIILMLVEDEAERIIRLRASECYDRVSAKINSKKLPMEEALKEGRKVVEKCIEEARRSVLNPR